MLPVRPALLPLALLVGLAVAWPQGAAGERGVPARKGSTATAAQPCHLPLSPPAGAPTHALALEASNRTEAVAWAACTFTVTSASLKNATAADLPSLHAAVDALAPGKGGTAGRAARPAAAIPPTPRPTCRRPPRLPPPWRGRRALRRDFPQHHHPRSPRRRRRGVRRNRRWAGPCSQGRWAHACQGLSRRQGPVWRARHARWLPLE